MKLRAIITDCQTDVQTNIQLWDEGGGVLAEVDGRRYELEVPESGPDGYVLISQGRVFNCRIEGRTESGKEIDVIVGTTNYAVTLTDPRRLGNSAAASTHGNDAARIIAPMPGKVLRVLDEAGARVEAGDGIIL